MVRPLFVLFWLVCATAFAQKSPIKFGDVPLEDLKMRTYENDTSAAAVILSDYGEAYITISSNYASLIFERHVRIKVLKKEGLSWGDVAIPLYYSGSAEEKVSSLKAASYNLENGQIVETKMSKESIFKERVNRNYNIQKFTIPNVKEGSVLEYSYKVVSDFLQNFPNWRFQYTIPVKRSEYWAILPDFFVFEKYMQGYLMVSNYEIKPHSLPGYQAKGHHWVIEHVPAFKAEPYMTNESDYVSKINFAISHYNFPNQPTIEVMGSWGKLNANLLASEAFGKIVTGSNFLKSTVDEVTAGMTDPKQKVAAIYHYVQQNIGWDGTEDFLADPLKKVFDKKKGTCGDINLALAAMLEKAGIPHNLVLLSTRDHGFVRKEYPMSRQLNYVVCLVELDGEQLWLDATEKYLPVGMLPQRCLNGEGLLISPNGSRWVPLQTKTRAKTVVSADLAVANTGELNGKLTYARDGYDALSMRKSYFAKGQEEYLKDLLGSRSWQIAKSEFLNLDTEGQMPREIHELSIQEHATVAGDAIYLNPFVTSQLESNPFKLEQRLYPVDFGPLMDRTYICRLVVPEDYTVDELPQSKSLVMPGNAARFLFNVVQTGNTINITSSMQINKNLFLNEEYPYLREFYNIVIAKQAEQIVLKKK